MSPRKTLRAIALFFNSREGVKESSFEVSVMIDFINCSGSNLLTFYLKVSF
jgi:hypothetical protein